MGQMRRGKPVAGSLPHIVLLLLLAAAMPAGCGWLDGLFLDDVGEQCVPDLSGSCVAGLSCKKVNDTTMIAWELEDSLHELVACGQLQAELMRALYGMLFEVLDAPEFFDVPRGVEYVDNGLFRIQIPPPSDGVMFVRLVAGQEYSFGATGTPLPADPFDPDSYLVGAHGNIDVDTWTGTITFERSGPLVEMLGVTAGVQSPIYFDRKDLERATQSLFSTLATSSVGIIDERIESRFSYEVTAPPVSVADAMLDYVDYVLNLLDDETATAIEPELRALQTSEVPSIRFFVRDVSGERSTLAQRLIVEQWALDYDLAGGALDGSVLTMTTGDRFDFRAKLIYESGTYANNIEFSCVEQAELE